MKKLAFILALGFISPIFAAVSQLYYSIPSQPLSSALVQFASATSSQYIVPMRLIDGISTAPLNGNYSAEQALSILLKGSGLVFERTANGTFVIKLPATPAAKIKLNSGDSSSVAIERIVVSAQKRMRTLQESPIAISVIESDGLDKIGKSNLRDTYLRTPALSYHGAISAAGQGMRVRGVGSGVIASGIEQSVGTIMDGVVTGPSGSGLQELWDMQRIEVLRGPQGTLFGKNMSAGAINSISNDPTDYFTGYLKAQHEFAYQDTRIDYALSGPVSDETTFRIAGFSTQQQVGNVYNKVRDEDENLRDHWGVRGKLHWAQDALSLKVSLSYDELDAKCCARVFSHLDTDSISEGTLEMIESALDKYNLTVSDDHNIAIAEGPIYEKSKTLHGVFELAYVFDTGHQLKAISGIRQWQHSSGNDGDNLPVDLVSYVADERKLNILSQEIQWLSPDNDHFEYILGAYYYYQDFPSTEYIGGGADVVGEVGVTEVRSTIDINHFALFGNGTWYLSPKWSTFLGLRVQSETITGEGQQQGDLWIWPTDYDKNSLSASDQDWMGSLGASYQFTPEHQVYTSVSRGYKGLAIDNASNSIFYRAPYLTDDGQLIEVEDALLEPETVINYELGSKHFFETYSAMVNATLFHSDFSNFQASSYDGNSNSFHLTNAGSIRSRGLELEAKFSLWDNGRFNGSFTWLDARYTDFKGAPCQVSQKVDGSCSSATGGQDLSGERLNETPKYQTFIEYVHDYYTDIGLFYGVINHAWRSEVIFDPDLDPNTKQAAYGLTNITVGWQSNDDFSVKLFINNLTDVNYANRIIDAPVLPGAFQRYPSNGRTYGLALQYDFF